MSPKFDNKQEEEENSTKRKRDDSDKKSNKRSKRNVVDEEETLEQPSVISKPKSIKINRSPVMTLWATIVAQHLYPDLSLAEALSLGRAVAGITAQAKGTSIGKYSKEHQAGKSGKKQEPSPNIEKFDVLGIEVKAKKVQTSDGEDVFRALTGKNKLQDPQAAMKYLEKRFGDALGYVMAEMSKAAKTCLKDNDGGREALESSSYSYYEHIRPQVPGGTKKWGAKGQLEINKLSDFYNQ